MLLFEQRSSRRTVAAWAWNRSALAYGVRVTAAISATMIYARLDYLIIVRLQPDQDAAAYAAAYSLVVAAFLIPMALMRTTLAHYAQSPTEALRAHVSAAVATGLVGGAGIATLGPYVVRLGFGIDNPQLTSGHRNPLQKSTQ